MPAPLHYKTEAREHAAAVERAAEYLNAVVKAGQLPLTPDEFEARVKEFYASLNDRLGTSNALLLAILTNQPCPQSLFAPWASTASIWQWRNAPEDPLPAVTLNGKVCITPKDFFAAFLKHGKAQP